MKYIVKVNGLVTYDKDDNGNREFEFDDEVKATREWYWYATYSSAESVELIAKGEE